MRFFNCLQIIAGYSAAPFGLQWIFTHDFPGDGYARFCGVVFYLAYIGFMAFCVYWGIEKWNQEMSK